MKAMVLAAGYGQRLRPMSERLPKALIPVGGRPMIDYPLLLLRHYGIREITINLHHLGEKIEEYLGSGEKMDLKIRYSKEDRLLDTAGGLFHARAFFAGEPFIVINADVLIDLPVDKLLAYHRRKRAVSTLVLRPDERADHFGPIEIDAEGRIRRFLGRQAPHDSTRPLDKLMFTGVQIMEPRVFNYMEGDSPLSLTRATYPRMLTEGLPLYGYPFHGYWQDLGTPDRIKEAEEKLALGEVKLHYLSQHAPNSAR